MVSCDNLKHESIYDAVLAPYLWQTEVDGHGFGDVEEPPVGGEGEGESVKTLENVGALVGLKDVHGHPGHRARPDVGAWERER